jgi:quinoprotein glucose dehydrogenase
MAALRRITAAPAALAFLAGAAMAADTPDTDWPLAHRDAGAQRYSPLTQITPANVGGLKQAWVYHLKPKGQERFRLSEATPLVIGQTMVLFSPFGQVIALDATTGQEKWKYDLPGDDVPAMRGGAYWKGGSGFPPSVIFGSREGKLYSLRLSDGTLNTRFAQGGILNLKTPEVMQTGMKLPYNLSSPPAIYKNIAITGAGTGEGPGGTNHGDGPAGDTRAWDLTTGKLLWTFHTVPRPGELGYDTWEPGSTKNRSGTNVWGHMTVDEARGIVYMPVGAPNFDRAGVGRAGNNLFSNSIVALDAATGKYLWHFQVTHHDVWDYDAASPPTLIDVRHGGKIIPAVVATNKSGLVFILDRVTGKPLYDVQERPVPHDSTVPGEKLSPTQPYPVKPEPMARTTFSRGELYKGEAKHQAYCEKLVDDNQMLMVPQYSPMVLGRYTMHLPASQGGINYYGGSFDPQRRLFVVNVNNLAQAIRVVQRPDGSFANEGPLAGLRRLWEPENDNMPCTATPWGQLVAVNVDTGNVAWRRTLGMTDTFPTGLQDTGRPGLGGTILTASGVTFIGATTDRRFRAFDTATGKALWSVRLPASAESTPSTYMGKDGRQYVAVTATGGGIVGAALESDAVVAFALPQH